MEDWGEAMRKDSVRAACLGALIAFGFPLRLEAAPPGDRPTARESQPVKPGKPGDDSLPEAIPAREKPNAPPEAAANDSPVDRGNEATRTRPAGGASTPPPVTTAIATVPGLTLTSAINAALRANPDLRSATERIQIADATLARARAEFFPKLSLAEAFVETNIAGLAFFLEVNQRRASLTQDFNHPGFVGNFSTLLTLQQNLYSGGRRTAEQLSAEERRRAAAFELAAARNELVFRVAEAYFRLLQARELVESRTAAVRQVQRHQELVQSRLDNGTAVRSDLLTVEVKLAEAREGLITATNQRELTWAILENVTGCKLPHDLPARVEPAPWTARVNAIESAISEAMGRRPELQASMSGVRGAMHEVDAARSGKRLSVDFIGNFSTFDINRNSGGNGLFVGLIASMNLFDGHRTKAQVSRASARVRELQAQHQRLLLDIELEVKRAYLALNEADERFRVASRAISQAAQSLQEIEDRYHDDKATITQLIDARVAATDARVRRANAAADVEIARAGLERVVGGLNDLLIR